MINFKITPEEWKEVMDTFFETNFMVEGFPSVYDFEKEDIIAHQLYSQEEYIIFPNGSKITFGKDKN
jgi:hypothetical protein